MFVFCIILVGVVFGVLRGWWIVAHHQRYVIRKITMSDGVTYYSSGRGGSIDWQQVVSWAEVEE